MDFLEGEILYFNKPHQWTSFDLVNKTRNLLRKSLGVKKIKVGHAGTLDPLATGVMILCTGKATKQIDSYLHQDKEYVATIKFGATTPSFDKETPEDATFPTTHITRELLESVLPQFLGEIQQIPPSFSAIRVQGQHAYELARKNAEVLMKPRTVRIDKLEILDFQPPFATIRVACAKGTYIRSLARDLGVAVHSGAYLESLERTKIGKISLADCITIEQFQELIGHEKNNNHEVIGI